MAVAALPRPQHVPVVLLHALRRIAASREGAKMALDLQGGIHNKGRRPLIIVKILMTMDQLMGNIVVAYGPVLVVIIRIKRRVLRILARGSD
uniref:Uncharacterized protein n=1 Tax=Oryza meridionalis TaxID=40149 RepID=A0A0E0EQJ7_9ORYZ